MIEYIRESTPCECPTCKGRGIVHKDFYLSTKPTTGKSNLEKGVTCRSCNGKGIIFSFKETPIDVQVQPQIQPYSPQIAHIEPYVNPPYTWTSCGTMHFGALSAGKIDEPDCYDSGSNNHCSNSAYFMNKDNSSEYMTTVLNDITNSKFYR